MADDPRWTPKHTPGKGDIEKVFAGLNTRLRKFKVAWGEEFLDRLQEKYVKGHGYDTGELRDSWEMKQRVNDIEFINPTSYASYVEYGTVNMFPQGQLRSTIMESEEIARVAAKKVGLK